MIRNSFQYKFTTIFIELATLVCSLTVAGSLSSIFIGGAVTSMVKPLPYTNLLTSHIFLAIPYILGYLYGAWCLYKLIRNPAYQGLLSNVYNPGIHSYTTIIQNSLFSLGMSVLCFGISISLINLILLLGFDLSYGTYIHLLLVSSDSRLYQLPKSIYLNVLIGLITVSSFGLTYLLNCTPSTPLDEKKSLKNDFINYISPKLFTLLGVILIGYTLIQIVSILNITINSYIYQILTSDRLITFCELIFGLCGMIIMVFGGKSHYSYNPVVNRIVCLASLYSAFSLSQAFSCLFIYLPSYTAPAVKALNFCSGLNNVFVFPKIFKDLGATDALNDTITAGVNKWNSND